MKSSLFRHDFEVLRSQLNFAADLKERSAVARDPLLRDLCAEEVSKAEKMGESLNEEILAMSLMCQSIATLFLAVNQKANEDRHFPYVPIDVVGEIAHIAKKKRELWT